MQKMALSAAATAQLQPLVMVVEMLQRRSAGQLTRNIIWLQFCIWVVPASDNVALQARR